MGQSSFAGDWARSGADGTPYPAIFDKIKTARLTYTVTADDLTNGGVLLTVPFGKFGAPFPDDNYTCAVNVEAASGSETSYFINGFSKTAAGITADVGEGASATTPGDVITVHVMAIHD